MDKNEQQEDAPMPEKPLLEEHEELIARAGARDGEKALWDLYYLAHAYEKGWDVKKDPEKAFELYRYAAAFRNRNAEYRLACLLSKSKDSSLACRMANAYFFRSSVNEFGHAGAQIEVIRRIMEGVGGPKNDIEALAKCYDGYFRQNPMLADFKNELENRLTSEQIIEAYRLNLEREQSLDGVNYGIWGDFVVSKGLGHEYLPFVMPDDLKQEFMDYCLEQGEADNPKALHELTVHFGFEPYFDLEQANKWFRAYSKHDKSAWYFLAQCYQDDNGKHTTESIAVLQEGAEHKCGSCQAELGVCYASGRGIEENLSEAYAWLSLATCDPWVINWPDRQVLQLEKRMSPEQIATGKRLAEQRLEFCDDLW